MPHNQPQKAPCEITETTLSQIASDHLLLVLTRRPLHLNSRLGGALQRTGFEAHRSAADTRATGLHFVQIAEKPNGTLTIEGTAKLLHHAGLTGTDDRTHFEIEKVIQLNLVLHYHRAGGDGVLRRIQRRAHDHRLRGLQVDQTVGNGCPEGHMRLRIDLEKRKRRLGHNLLIEDVLMAADGARLNQFGNAVAIEVPANVVLAVEHLSHGRIGRVGFTAEGAIRTPCKVFLVRLELGVAIAAVRDKLVIVVAHGHKRGDRYKPPMNDVFRVLQPGGATVDQELLGRHQRHHSLALPAGAPDPHGQGNIPHHLGIRRHRLAGQDLHLAIKRARLDDLAIEHQLLLKDLQLGIETQNLRDLRRQTLVFLLDPLVIVLPPPLHHTRLADEGILHGTRQDAIARIVLQEGMVDEDGRLFGVILVLGSGSRELKHIVSAEKHTLQTRQDTKNRVPNLRQDDL